MSVLNDEIVAEVAKRLKRNEFNFRIKDYLKANGVSEEDSELYLDAAKKHILEKTMAQLPVRNKAIFISAIVVSLTSFILFVFVLPAQQFTRTGWWSFLGAVLFTTSAVTALLSLNSWKINEEERPTYEDLKRPQEINLLSFIGMISLAPIVIIHFIFSWNFDRVSDKILKENQVEVIGTIVGGSSMTSRRFDFTEVRVSFFTIDGQQMVVEKDVSQYDFKRFYQGQQVPMIYSSKNPEVIELFNRDSKLQEFKGTEERSLKPSDLLKFINLNDEEITSQLNIIAYGWEYNVAYERWENQKRSSVLYRSLDGISLLADNAAMFVFARDLKELGFKEELKDGVVQISYARTSRKFVSENYIALIEATSIGGNKNMPLYITTITKR